MSEDFSSEQFSTITNEMTLDVVLWFQLTQTELNERERHETLFKMWMFEDM